MTHWGWYWNVKLKHKPKGLCSYQRFAEIDSFSLFKNKQLVEFVRTSNDKTCITIPAYDLVMSLTDDDDLRVKYRDGTYIIPTESMPCTYGGSYRFFRCPDCAKRVRKLYCNEGRYRCRVCLRLGYLSQRLRPSDRHLMASGNISDLMYDRGGGIDRKPPRMWHKTFQKLRSLYYAREVEFRRATSKELIEWYGSKALLYLEDCYIPLSGTNYTSNDRSLP